MFKKSTISPDQKFLPQLRPYIGSSTVCRIVTLLSILLASYVSHGQTQASGITFRPVGGNNTSLRIDWTSGVSTDGRIVIIKNGAGTFKPTNGANISTLSANSNFSTAADLDASAGGVAKAVYAAAGAGATISVSNLVANTPYFVQVYEFTGTAASPTYLLTTNATNPLGFVFYTSDGTFTVPIDITTVTAQAWGAGGGGGEGASGNGGPGGGGGAYAIGTASVSFGVDPTITVGTGGGAGDDNDPGSPGDPSSFGSDVIALGGTQTNSGATGSVGGSGPGSTGNIDTNSGGSGGDGSATTNRGGGGGGSSATTTGDGVAGSNHSSGTGGNGGNGDDGDGGKGGDNGSSNAQPGTFPGGGGGGRGDGGGTGGAGAGGLVIVSFNDNTAPSASIIRQNPTGEFTNISPVTFRVTFNENVGNVNAADFTITGTATATIGTVTPNSEVEYDVQVNVTADGTLDLDFAGGHDIVDISNNAFAGTTTTDETYTIDTADPGFTTVEVSPNSGTAIINDIVTITLTANGAEQGLNPGTVEVNGITQTLTDNTDGTYTVSYTVTSGHTDWGAGALPISIEVTDDAGNAITVTAFTDGNTLAGDANEPTNENTVFAASVAASPGETVAITSSGDVNNDVWVAPAGITSSSSLTGDGGATMTQATDGTSTTIVAPTTEGDYKLYVVDAAGNISSESTATLSIFSQASSIEFGSASNASDELEFSWTGGTGQNTVVLVKTTNAVTGSDYPLVDGFNPTANTDFGSGTDLNGGATGTIKCVFESNSNGPITISNLSSGTEYIIEVHEYTGSHIYLRPALSTTRFTANGTNPNTAATNMTFTSVTNNSVTVQFTQGNGASSVLVARAGGSVGFTPEDGVSYTANTDYSAGTDLGSGDKIIAFRTDAASGTPITVTGLSADVTYHFAVFEMNGTQGNGTENYSSVNLTGNRSTEPLTQASGLNFTSVSETGMTLNWTAGDGNARLVIMRAGAAVATNPTDYTSYTASNDFDFGLFPGGSAIGAGYVVYDGTSNNVSITDLLPGTTYHFAVYEYNTATSESAPNQVFLTPAATASQTTTSDVTPPAANTVGTVAATGGRVVAGYYNATNTGLDVTVPLNSSDGSLDGGTIQIKVQNTANTGYVDIANDGLYTILPADRSAGTVTISIASADLEAAFSGLMGFSEGAADNASSAETKLLQITATVTDNAANSTTYTESSTDIDVDQTPPSVVTSFSFYPDAGIQNTNREVIMFRLSEDLYNSGGSLVSDNTVLVNAVNKPYGGTGFSVDDPGASSNDVDANYVRYESDGGPNAEDNTVFNNRLIWVESNNNNSNWSNSASPVTKIQYVPFGNGSSATELIRDAAGNELGTIPETAVVSGDVVAPALSPDVMTLYPRAGNPEKIVFTFSEALSTPTTANAVTGFSTSTGAIGDATYSEASPGVCPCTITLTSSAHGAWTSTTLVSYNQATGNVLDLAGTPNELATITNHAVVVETTAPSITAVSIPNSTMKVGTVVPVTITTTDDDGDAPVFSGTFTIGGFTLSGLTYVNGTTKTAQFTVTEGGANVAAGSNIPVNITLQDGQGNTSTAFTTAIVQGSDPIDANSPTITSITNSVNPVYEGALTQTVTVVYSEPMNTAVQPVITLNGATANWGAQTASGGTNGWVGNTYTATFTHNATQETVSGMSTSVAVGGAQDAAGNPNLGNAASTSFNLDNQKPTVAAISTSLSAVTSINNTIRVSIRYGESMNTASAPTVTISNGTFGAGVPASGAGYTNGWRTVVFTNDTYDIDFTNGTTNEEFTGVTASANGATDANGNVQTTSAASAGFIIDTQRPTILSVTRYNPLSQKTNAASIEYRVIFSENVAGLDFPNFGTKVIVNDPLVNPGSVSGGIQIAGNNADWAISVVGVSGDGEIGMDVLADIGNIVDDYGNPLMTDFTTGETYEIDQTVPTVQTIDISSPTESWSTANGTFSSALTWLVTFSEDVTGVDAADFTLNRNTGTDLTFDNVAGVGSLVVTGSGNTRTVTLNNVDLLNVSSTAQLYVNLVDNNSIADVAGNLLGGPLAGDGTLNSPLPAYPGSSSPGFNDYYTVLFPEPSDPAINFSIVNQTPTSIEFQWAPASSPATAPNYYFVQIKKTNASFTALTDGSYIPFLDDDFSDGHLGTLVGGATLTFNTSDYFTTPLSSGVDYDIRITSVSYSGFYNNQYHMDYLIGSTLNSPVHTLPTLSPPNTTTAASGTLTGSTITSTISSTVTSSTGLSVFQFTVTDDGATPGADDAPFKFSTLTIKEGGTDLVADWSTVIAGARLVDANGEFVDAGSIGSNSITFTTPSTDPGPTPTDIGFVPDNTSKTYTLRIWLHPTQTDQTRLDFRVDDISFTPDDSYDISQSSQRSSKFNGTPSVETGSIFVNVIATAFAFTTQPIPTSTLVLTDFSTPPQAKAVDANGNVDTGYNGPLFNVTVTNTGALPMLPGGTHPITRTPSLGVINFPADFQYTAAGNGTLTVARGGISSNAGAGNVPCSPVTVSYSNLSTITGGTGVARVLSTVTASPGAAVFSFTYNDDGGLSLGDGANTEISKIKITPDGTNELDWSVLLAGAELTDGTNTVAASSIDATGITFDGAAFTSSPLSTVVDGALSASKTYTLNVWFKTDLGTLAETADEEHLVFSMSTDPSNLTLEATSSNAPAAAAETSGSGNGIFEVDATRLVFTTDFTGALTMPPVPPTANGAIDFLVNTSTTAQSFSDPIVQAVDVNGNVDEGYSSAVTVTPAAGMALSNELASVTNGTGTFSGSFEYDAIGNGTLTVSTATPNRVGGTVSPTTNGQTVNVKTGTASTIDAVSTVAAATISSITNASSGEVVFTFRLDDDPAGTPPLQDDGTPTLVDKIVITGASANNTITDWTEAIAGARLEDAADDTKFVDLAPADIGASSLTFSSIPFASGELGYISDDDTKTYNLKIWLKSDLTGLQTYDRLIDGLEFGFDLLSANVDTDPTGTSFLASQQANAANDATTVEVTATQIDFVTPDPASSPVSASLFVPLNVEVEARDANGNLDLGFNSSITDVSNETDATMIGDNGEEIGDANSGIEYGVTSFSGGLFTFPATFQYTTGDNEDDVTLSLTAGGVSSIPLASPPNPGPTTPYIELSSSFQSRISATLGPQNIDYALAANQAIDIDLSSGDGYVIEELVLSDGDADGTIGDDDGAATVLNSLTLGITNPQSIRRIALYTNNGAWVEEAEQPGSNIVVSSGYGQITFSGLSISADDNDALETNSKTVYVVVTFEDNPTDIVDNSVIQINVVGAATGGGSKFRGETGDPLGGSFIGGIATTLAPAQPVDAGAIGAQNAIEVLATSLDFVTPASDYAGTNEPIGPSYTTAPLPSTSAAIVHARDKFEVVDLDFNYSPTVSGAGATSSASFVNGVLDLDGLYYTSSGNGTITVAANGIDSSNPGPDNIGNSIPGQMVNVINVTALPNTNGVLATPNIKGGTPNAVLFGVTFSPDHATTTEPSLKQFKIRFHQPYRTPSYTTLKNFRVTYSENGIYGDSNPVSVVDATVSEAQSPSAGASDFDMVVVDWGANPPLPLFDGSGNKKPITFYLVADVDVSANISTPSLKPMLVDPGYTSPPLAANANIVTTAGTAVADNDPNDATISGVIEGIEFHFATTRPPVLLASQGSQTSPFVGQLNVNLPLTEIALEFDVQVWSFDGKAALWDRNSRTKVADLNAINGQYVDPSTPTANPIRFAVNLLPGKSLKNDSVYYVTIEKGSFDNGTQTGTGISDNGFNFYGGISSNGILYFKIESAFPPNVSDADQVFINPNTGVFSAVFDKRGTGYYMIIQAENYSGTAPTAADIRSPAAYIAANPNSVRSAGSFAINTVNEPQFVSFSRNVSPFTPFAPNKDYHVWIFGENDATPPVQAGFPYANAANNYKHDAAYGVPTVTLTVPPAASISNVYQPVYLLCPNSTILLTEPIVISEPPLSSGLFSMAGTQEFYILLPTGYEFGGILPSVQLNGDDFVSSSLSVSFENSTLVRVAYENTGSGSVDNIVISGLQVRGEENAAPGIIKRFSGNASLGTLLGPNNRLASISLKTSPDLEFTNSFSVDNNFTPYLLFNATSIITAIPDNYIDQDPTLSGQIRLFPLILQENDYGASFFSGTGVSNDILTLSAVPKDAPFDITMTHTDMNGCVSETQVQHVVYDHNNPISEKLGMGITPLGTNQTLTNLAFEQNPFASPPSYVTKPSISLDNPDPSLPQILHNELAGYKLLELFAELPQNTADQIMKRGTDWEALVAKTPKAIKRILDSNAPLRGGVILTNYYQDYQWDYSYILNSVAESDSLNTPGGNITIQPYDYFRFETASGSGKYYWKGGSLGKVEFTGVFQNQADLTVIVPFKQQVELFVPPIPLIEAVNHRPFAGDTAIFCKDQLPDVLLTGFPRPDGNTSTGYFQIFDAVDHSNVIFNGLDKDIDNDGEADYLEFTDVSGSVSFRASDVTNDFKAMMVVYTYQDIGAPQSGSDTVYIRVTPNPVADFTYSTLCEDIPVEFTNISTIEPAPGATITSYVWGFGDINSGANSSTEQSPSYTYTTPGLYPNVNLVAASNYGCESVIPKRFDFQIGGTPVVDFSFTGISTADSIMFNSGSSIASNDSYDSLIWAYGDSGEKRQNYTNQASNPAETFKHLYNAAGQYTVNLMVMTDIGCISEASKLVVIVPHVNLEESGAHYFEDFQDNDGGFQFLGESATPSSWEWGNPQGVAINSNAATDRAWVTNLDGSYLPNEKSALYTASFDIADLTRPIITFNSFRHLGSSDGVVVEYSTDNLNVADPNKNWTTLGAVTNGLPTGVEWYKGVSLAAKPGQEETGFGWTDRDTIWRESKHSLASIPVMERGQVVFRFSLASVNSDPTQGPDQPDLEGFGVDELRIGNGTRTVLVENFTNTGVEDVTLQQQVKDENEAFREFQETSVGIEVIKIDYHVGFPGEDPFNQENSMDPGARALYYNIASVPEARMDGLSGPSSELSFSEWGEQQFSERILFLAEADIDLTSAVTPEGELSVTVNFTPLVDFAQPTLLHVAILEENVATTDNPSLESGRIATGETDFKYVLRKMLPNAAGTKYNTLTEGQATEPLTFTWSNANLFNPEDDIVVVAFLQDESSRRIYQAEIVRGVEDPSVVTGIEDLNTSFNVYPNPADKELIVTLPHVPTQSTIIQMFDQMGKVVSEGYFDAGQSTKNISTEDFAGGVYVIQVRSEKGVLRRKVMVVHRN